MSEPTSLRDEIDAYLRELLGTPRLRSPADRSVYPEETRQQSEAEGPQGVAMRTAAAIMLAMGLAGCATSAADDWSHEQKGLQDFYADYATCDALAGMASAGTGSVKIALVQQVFAHRNCMLGQGWRRDGTPVSERPSGLQEAPVGDPIENCAQYMSMREIDKRMFTGSIVYRLITERGVALGPGSALIALNPELQSTLDGFCSDGDGAVSGRPISGPLDRLADDIRSALAGLGAPLGEG